MIISRLNRFCTLLVAAAALSACSVKPPVNTGTVQAGIKPSQAKDIVVPKSASVRPANIEPSGGNDLKTLPDKSSKTEKLPVPNTRGRLSQLQPLSIVSAARTGRLNHSQLNEVSGLSASVDYPGLLYAINDSGNKPRLYAIDESGRLLSQWDVNVNNRDWEDLSTVHLAGTHYLVIGDTGDNLLAHNTARLHLLREPEYPSVNKSINVDHTITYRYEDGSRNVEAFSAIDNSLYLLSKEPVTNGQQAPHRIYQLDLPDDPGALPGSTILTARLVGTMPLRSGGIEARLAAVLAGVDLTHPTAMEFDEFNNAAYILTYREVLRIRRERGQSWSDALTKRAERIFSHNLAQAEALAISPGRAIWFTSEKNEAPLWAIPLSPPL